jgi:hypothetical protein
VLRNFLLSGVRNRCQPLRSLPFSSNFCLINIEHSCVLNVAVCSDVAYYYVMDTEIIITLKANELTVSN